MEFRNSSRLSEHQALYLQQTRQTTILDSKEVSNNPKSGRTIFEPLCMSIVEVYHTIGWYILLASEPTTFLIGRTTKFSAQRSVDIVLVSYKGRRLRIVEPIHFIFLMHTDTGAWIPRAVHETQADQQVLVKGESTCLCQPSTRVPVNGLNFIFRCTITNRDHEKIYLEYRQ